MTLDDALHLWAEWIVSGGHERRGFHSQIHMMMVTRCEFSGSTGVSHDGIAVDGVEADVEAALMALREQSMDKADVIVAAYCKPGTDAQKALSMGISLRCFRDRKQQAKQFISRRLAERRGVRG